MNYTLKQALESLPISYLGSNFKEWLLPMPFNKKKKCKSLTSQKLPRRMNNESILKELNPGEVSIEDIVETLKTMDHSIWAIFYCKDISGVLRTVDAYWSGGGWIVYADAVADPDEWSAGDQVFSRNSRSPQSLGSSDPLPSGHFDPRLSDANYSALDMRLVNLEEWKAKVETLIRQL